MNTACGHPRTRIWKRYDRWKSAAGRMIAMIRVCDDCGDSWETEAFKPAPSTPYYA